ncbi:MAG: VWA domain-containing protein [Crocinitomicaceae bacterium]
MKLFVMIPTPVRLSLLLLFLWMLPGAHAQGVLNFHLTVYDANQQPKANCPVVIIETSSFKRKEFKTDQEGKLKIVLDEGKQWTANIGAMRNHNLLNVPESGVSNASAVATYDPERWKQLNTPPPNRSSIDFDEIIQRLPYNARPDANNELLEIAVVSEYGKVYGGMDVALVCAATATKYTATTDHEGIARFKIPLNQEYQIDLDGEEDFEQHKVGDKPFKRRITLTYTTIRFKETINKAGYIEQSFQDPLKPISNRVLVGVQVMGGPNNGKGEDIYLEMTYSNKKYHGTTNQEGMVYFLLPKKHAYRVNFNYQDGAGVIDLTRFYGIGNMNTGFMYVPEERLQYPERFLPTKKDVPSLDINDFVSKTYPDTEDDELINVHVKWGSNKINSSSKEAILEIGFSVKEPEEKKSLSKPLNIVFVLDKSGSMAGENIDVLKSAMFHFIERLRPQDHVALIFFDTEAVIAYESKAVNQKILKDIVGAAQASGGTSIYEGLKLGYQEVSKHSDDQSVDRLILLTDGYGSKPVEEVLELSANYFKKGLTISTIGVGTSYNAALLTLLSQYSGGAEHHAIESDKIPLALDKEFESLLYPLASNLKVKVKYNNKIIYKTLYGAPEFSNTNSAVTFKLSKIYSSFNKMALLKFKLENADKDIEKEKISIQVSYFDEQKQEQIEIVRETQLEWTEETDVEMLYDQDMKNAYSIAVINQSLKVIADLCDSENYKAARDQLNETIKSLKKITNEKYTDEMIPVLEMIKDYMRGLDQALKNQAGMK